MFTLVYVDVPACEYAFEGVPDLRLSRQLCLGMAIPSVANFQLGHPIDPQWKHEQFFDLSDRDEQGTLGELIICT